MTDTYLRIVYSQLLEHGGNGARPAARRFLLDLPDAASLHLPGALLVQQCRRDALYPLPGMQASVDKLTKIYAKAGIAEKFRGTFYDDTHSFRPAMQEEAFDWLEKWL